MNNMLIKYELRTVVCHMYLRCPWPNLMQCPSPHEFAKHHLSASNLFYGTDPGYINSQLSAESVQRPKLNPALRNQTFSCISGVTKISNLKLKWRKEPNSTAVKNHADKSEFIFGGSSVHWPGPGQCNLNYCQRSSCCFCCWWNSVWRNDTEQNGVLRARSARKQWSTIGEI